MRRRIVAPAVLVLLMVPAVDRTLVGAVAGGGEPAARWLGQVLALIAGH